MSFVQVHKWCRPCWPQSKCHSDHRGSPSHQYEWFEMQTQHRSSPKGIPHLSREIVVTGTNCYLKLCIFYSVPYGGTQPPLCWWINNTWAELLAKQQKPKLFDLRNHHSSPPPSSLLSSESGPSAALAMELEPRRCPGARERDASFIGEVSSHTGDVD